MSEPSIVEISDLEVAFKVRTGRRGKRELLRAVNRASLSVGRGETVAVVGESGSGKSTMARAVLRQVALRGGTVRIDGVDVTSMRSREFRALRRKVQMVFQDPYSSLDPAMTVAESIAEPLVVHTNLNRRERHDRVAELLDVVGLSARHLDRYPYEFSGGQRQRLAIARAVALNPEAVLCDEPVSALDMSTQNQIINLLKDLQAQFGVSLLFISHDLAVVRHIAHRVAVMYLGSIVETGPAERVFSRPAHPYTKALLAAVPVPDPEVQQAGRRPSIRGDAFSGTTTAGCPFAGRCPEAMDLCREQTPPDFPVDGGGVGACWLLAEKVA
ncbi:ABC transporter ATP-binding protein [Amycolatopsis pithecellobii]|uniref:ATP-binding cassette domain-containing protein n=1 Tax=Amycolatopsis pithecellobii TaxID=664692 RepID=A0A6N7Z044_9PSEU|nr:ABC transporter ATP-binding protein [Amycolatopsis pithecellobii]MTD57602.1 ATP-binding cassette domain-containing protein [Amycolatopsis pithecellobii]